MRWEKAADFPDAEGAAFEATEERQKITINIKVKTIAVSEDQKVRERCD